MPKLVCEKCKCELKLHKTGTTVIEMSDAIGPYKIWDADTWKCPGCGVEITAGFPDHPLAEHYERSFPNLLKRVKEKAERLVYDYEKPQSHHIVVCEHCGGEGVLPIMTGEGEQVGESYCPKCGGSGWVVPDDE